MLLLSCAHKKDKFAIGQDSLHETKVSDQLLYSVSAEHFFSSNQVKDKFRLELIGKDTLSGLVKFQILNSSGDSIYSIVFESRALFDYGLPDNSTEVEEGKYVIKRLDNFFNAENFVKPAIGSSEVYDSAYYDVINEDNWKIVKSDSQLTGFYYLLWEGDQTWLTFLKEDKKVVKYKICC